MTITILNGSLLKNKKNIVSSISQWPLVVAFMSGMVLTAGIAQVLGLTGGTMQKEPVIPAPQNTPGLIDPGYYPRYSPGEYGLIELA